MLRGAGAARGGAGTYEIGRLDSAPHECRVRFTSALDPVLTAGVELASETLVVHFFLERTPDLMIVRADDYEPRGDGYALDRIREVVRLVAAFLRGEGSVEPRRSALGRRRSQLRLRVDGREWLAR